MNAGIQVNFKNNYRVELIDASTGHLKKSGDFHNIVVEGLYSLLTGHYNKMLAGLQVGSGTSAPASTDTSLSRPLWRVEGSAVNFSWLNDYTGRASCTYTFPATSDYVGTVTEVGLWCRGLRRVGEWDIGSGKLVTHALLTDSEGQIFSFEKTDIDILKITVTVEMTLSSSSESFKIFKRNLITRNILDGSGARSDSTALNSTYGHTNLCRYYSDMELASAFYDTSVDQVLTSTPVVDEALRSITYPSTRLLATTITDERYFKAVAIPAIGYWVLPNEEIFPAYDIKNIAVGTGDGTTTAFTNPLCYFKKDTDKVYKNGVQLTRGTDYTINNVGNNKCLPEVAEFDMPISVQSGISSTTTLARTLLFVPTVQTRDTLYGSIKNSLFKSFSLTFKQSNPLYIEYAEAVTFNCLKCVGTFVAFSGTNGFNNIPVGATIYIEYSLNGEDYTELGSYVTTSTSNHTFSIDFEDTTAKYWRLRIVTNVSGEIGFSSNVTGEQFITLNRKDPYITFAEAPADGDIITMDVSMDVIMKNANFVVDAGCTISFQM